MRRLTHALAIVSTALCLLGTSGCERPAQQEHVVQPAVPSAPVAEPAQQAPEPALPQGVDVPGSGQAKAGVHEEAAKLAKLAAETGAAQERKRASTSTSTSTKAEEVAKAPKPAAAPKPAPAAEPDPAPAPKPEPAPAPKPEPAPKAHVTVPSTAHVRVEIPAGMQALLDADTRMQPWVNKAIPIIDRCYVSKGGGTTATIKGVVTMHQNERPDVDLSSLPPSLAGVVACATGDLMRNRMPLFTGPEGQRHTLRVRFSP